MSKLDTKESFLNSLLDFKAEDIEAYKTRAETLFPKGGTFFESNDDKLNFVRNYMRNLRLFLEKQMENSISNIKTFYDEHTREILRFTFWLANHGVIDTSNAYVIMEDIYDCLPISEIIPFFDFLEELTKTQKVFVSTQQQAMLRIGNGILKKFSKVHDNDFRGRVQLLLSNITSLSEKTGVNLRSNINTQNVTTFETTNVEKDSMLNVTADNCPKISFSFYQKFWELQKFLHNPSLLFSDGTSILLQPDVEEDELKNMDGEVIEVPNIAHQTAKKTVYENKLDAFCKFTTDIIEIFKSDPVMDNQDVPYTAHYPKYFTKSSLLAIQLRDPDFRKIWLAQSLLCVWSLKNPIKIGGKKIFELSEKDLEKVSALEKHLTEYMKEIKNPHEKVTFLDKVNLFLEREKNWTKWKENGCPSFERSVPSDVSSKLDNLIDQSGLLASLNKAEKDPEGPNFYPNYKVMNDNYKTIRESSQRFLRDTYFDQDNKVFSYLNPPQLPTELQPTEPGVSYYFNSFLSEMKDPTLAEEDKLANDPTSVWRALRVLARNFINLFSTASTTQKNDVVELKLSDILKKMVKTDGPVVGEKAEETQEQKQATEDKEKKKEPEEKLEAGEIPRSEIKETKTEMKDENEEKKEKGDSDKMIPEKAEAVEATPEVKESPMESEPTTEVKEVKEVKTETLSITERIKSKILENEKSEKNGDAPESPSVNIKRPAEGELDEFEKQSSSAKKNKT